MKKINDSIDKIEDDYKNNKDELNLIKFLGGKTTPYILSIILLIGLIIMIFSQITYIFKPIIIILNTLLAPVIISLVLFYILNPIVNFMQRNRVNRVTAIIILFVIIGFAQLFIINAMIPIAGDQIKSIIKNLPEYIVNFNNSIDVLTQKTLLNDLTYQIKQQMTSFVMHIPDNITNSLDNPTQQIKKLMSTLMNVAVVFATTPFVLFFMLKDGPRFRYFVIKILPMKHRKDALSLIYQFNEKVGSYIQGQIIVAICIGILLFIGYSIIGLKYALVLALIAAVTSVVPYLGPMIAISPAIIIALMTSPIMLLKLGVVWIVVQFVEGHFISPNIMGKTLQIHPLTIIFVLLCAGKIAGIIGVMLGIPGYAVLKVLFEFIFSKIKDRYNRIYSKEKGYQQDENEEIDHVEFVIPQYKIKYNRLPKYLIYTKKENS